MTRRPRRGRRSRRGVPRRPSRPATAPSPSRATPADAPDRPVPRAAGERPGALRRLGRGRVPRGQRAVRPGRGDRHLPAPRRRDARPTRAGRPPPGPDRRRGRRPGRHPRRHRADAYDGTALPVREADELQRRPDHDPGHRPRRLPPLPPEGDLRGARLVPQDAAGQDRRSRAGDGDPSAGTSTPGAARRRDAARGPGRGVATAADPARRSSSARAPPPSLGRASPFALDDVGRGTADRRGCRTPPSCPGSGSATT